jgi:hypothetical protein
MTQAESAWSTTLSWNGVEVAELQSIAGPVEKMATIDVTTLKSPDLYSEFIPSFVNGGQISVEGNFTNEPGQAGLRADFEQRIGRPLVITLPNEETWIAFAWCTGLEEDQKVADRLAFRATFQVSAKPLFGLFMQQVTQMAQVVATPSTGPVAAEVTQLAVVAIQNV